MVINRGDTLSAIFDRLGLDHRDLYRLLAHKETKRRLSRIRPEQVLEFHRDPQGALDHMQGFQITMGGDLQDRAQCGQSQVTRAHGVMAFVLEVVKEGQDQFRCDIGQCHRF